MREVCVHEAMRNACGRLLVAPLCLCLAFVASPKCVGAQDLRPLSASLAARLNASDRKLIAVIDFTDLQGNVTELGRFLAEELSVALVSDAKNFEVIDRTNLKAILQEHKLASTGVIDPQTARQLGKIAGVDGLVTGTLTPFGDSVRLSAKALDTETAKILGAATADIAKTKAIEELLARGIGQAQPTQAPSSASSLTTRGTQPSSQRAAPSGASYQNDFLAVQVDSVGVSQERGRWRASVALTLENTASEEAFLAYITNSGAISDAQGRRWNIESFSGLPMTYSNPPGRQELSRIAPGSRQTAILTFSAYADADGQKPTHLSVTMMLWRLRGTTPERFSVGISQAPVTR